MVSVAISFAKTVLVLTTVTVATSVLSSMILSKVNPEKKQ